MNFGKDGLFDNFCMKSSYTHGLEGNITVILYEIVQNASPVVDPTRMGNSDARSYRNLQRIVNSNQVTSDIGKDLIVIRSAGIRECMNSVAYAYKFKTNTEVPDSLGDITTSETNA